jgi:hypothetical protein
MSILHRSHETLFFSHKKSVNNTFCHGLSAKRTKQDRYLKPCQDTKQAFAWGKKLLAKPCHSCSMMSAELQITPAAL